MKLIQQNVSDSVRDGKIEIVCLGDLHIGDQNADMKMIWKYNAKESIQSDYDKLNAEFRIVGDDINKKSQELPKELVKVQTAYRDKIKYIERWHEDGNKTNCENAIDFGRSYQPTGLLY